MTSRRRAPQPVCDARPFRRIRRGLDDNQLRASLVATVKFRVERPRKRLRVMRNHAYAAEIFHRGNVCMRDDVAVLNFEF